MIEIGVDEAGRGAWAGPLIVAAVSFPVNSESRVYFDSKSLNSLTRERLYKELCKNAQIGVGWSSAHAVDTIGLSRALRDCANTAIAKLYRPSATILLDGAYNFCDYEVQTVVRGDVKCESISAASIVAKHLRDAYMRKLHILKPDYGFANHVGYGTKLHHQALKQLGVTSQHRKSYKPVQALL